MNSLVPANRNLEVEGAIAQFGALVKRGVEAWTMAGEILVRLIAQDAGIFNKIMDAHPRITLQMLHAFERIGNKMVYPPLLADSSLAGRALMELPFEDQKKCWHEKLEVVTGFKDGKTLIAMKRIGEMSRDEVRMVFGKGNIRTRDEQVVRFKEIEAFEIQKEKPRPAFVDYKRVEIGHFMIVADDKNNLTIQPCPASTKAHAVRVIPFQDGWKSAVCVFYRESKK